LAAVARPPVPGIRRRVTDRRNRRLVQLLEAENREDFLRRFLRFAEDGGKKPQLRLGPALRVAKRSFCYRRGTAFAAYLVREGLWVDVNASNRRRISVRRRFISSSSVAGGRASGLRAAPDSR
jgi:hypothetical protein